MDTATGGFPADAPVCSSAAPCPPGWGCFQATAGALTGLCLRACLEPPVVDGGTPDGGADAGTDPCGSVPTSGRCLAGANTLEICGVATGSALPVVVTVPCRAGETCQVADGRAACVQTAQCLAGEARCVNGTTLQSCNAGTWSQSTCPSRCVDNPLMAFCAPAVATSTFSGTLQYEYRQPNAAMTDWATSVTVAPASAVLVLSYQGSTVLDATTTDGNGDYTVEVPAAATGNDRIVYLAAAGNGRGGLRYVVADPKVAAAKTNPLQGFPQGQIWLWSQASTAAPGQVLTITEAQGSPALRLYDFLSGIYEGTSAIYGRDGPPLVVWMGTGVTWTCGACFFALPTDVKGSAFGAQVVIPGDANWGYYSDAVTSHELGHWVMSSYGTSPQEGGAHSLGIPTFPGQAWSEGFATWFSSAARGNSRYFDKQGGGFFWVDLAARSYSTAIPWTRPVAANGLLQRQDENDVSATLLAISSAQSDGTFHVLKSLSSPAMNASPWGRGYTRHTWDIDTSGGGWTLTNEVDTGLPRPFLADLLDALVCSGVPATTIDAATAPATSYPYPSNAPLCPGGPCTGCRDSGGACQPGTTTAACGGFGTACATCGAGETCVTGQCRRPAGVACSWSSDCASNVCLLDFRSGTQGHCRAACNPQAPACAATEVCLGFTATEGACVAAASPTSRWKVQVNSATVKPLAPASGAAWDALGGLPDPFACVTTTATPSTCTATVADTLTPAWPSRLNRVYTWSDLGSVTLNVWDEDVASNDAIDSIVGESLQCPWAAYACQTTIQRSSVATAGLESITLVIEPQ